jgi:hypothetical protein
MVRLMKKKDRQFEEFLRNVKTRQHNVVFPNTLENEAEGWRRIYSRKRSLSGAQLIGTVSLIIALLVFLVGILSVFGLYLAHGNSAMLQRVFRVTFAWLFVLVPLGTFFYLMRRSLRRR